MTRRLDKKASTSEFPIILLILIFAAIILFIVFFPMIKEAFRNFLILLNLEDEKDTYIRSFDVEPGLEGALRFSFRFINDQDIAGYELNATRLTGENTLGVIPKREMERITGIMFEERLRKEYLVNGKEVTYNHPAPSGLDEKKYILYALDSSGKVLQERSVDWPGMFEQQNEYLPQITVFMDFAKGLRGLGEKKTAMLLYKDEIILMGFSKDFNEGACGYLNQGIGCKKDYIPMPEECAEVKSCLCLCRRVQEKEDFCGEKGRICYGYDEYDLIGGTKRTCGIMENGLFGGKKQGEWGEDNAPILTWRSKVFEDENDEFNSLAISIDKDKSERLTLDVEPKVLSLVAEGKTVKVEALVISK